MINSDLKRLALLLIEKDVSKKIKGVKDITNLFREDLQGRDIENNANFIIPKLKGVLRKNSTELRLLCVTCLEEIAKKAPQQGMNALLYIVKDNHNSFVKLTALTQLYSLREYQQCSKVALEDLEVAFTVFDLGYDYIKAGRDVLLHYGQYAGKEFLTYLRSKCKRWKDDIDKCTTIFGIWLLRPVDVGYDEYDFAFGRSLSNYRQIRNASIAFLASLENVGRKIVLNAYCDESWKGLPFSLTYSEHLELAIRKSPLAYLESLLEILAPTESFDRLTLGSDLLKQIYNELMVEEYSPIKDNYGIQPKYKMVLKKLAKEHKSKLKDVVTRYYAISLNWKNSPEKIPFDIEIYHLLIDWGK